MTEDNGTDENDDDRSLHIPGQIGTRDREGWRTFQSPGDVCLGCSNPRLGHWVPISQCGTALVKFVLDELELQRRQEEILREHYLATRDSEDEW